MAENEEELSASAVGKGDSYPKGGKDNPKRTARPRPPKDLVVDQYNPDGASHQGGGWAVFEYPSPGEIEPSIEAVRHHVEDRVRRAGYVVDGDVLPYNKDDNSFRVAVRYA